MSQNTYELSYGNTYKIGKGNFEDIPIGQYENCNPFYNLKRVITVEDGIEIDLADEFEEMRELIDGQLYKAVKKAKTQPISLEGLRIKEIEGIRYPSVTTILSGGVQPEIPNLDLYALRGNMWDRVFQRMVGEAKYVTDFTPAELTQIEVIGGMKGHSLRWAYDSNDLDFRGGHTEVINKKDVYYGTYDADGFYKKEPAVFDCKSGKLSKQMIEKSFMQIAAYCMAKDELPKYMVIIPTQQVEPIVSEEIEKYYRKFMELRKTFKETYGC